jgi:hypothetical protein
MNLCYQQTLLIVENALKVNQGGKFTDKSSKWNEEFEEFKTNYSNQISLISSRKDSIKNFNDTFFSIITDMNEKDSSPEAIITDEIRHEISAYKELYSQFLCLFYFSMLYRNSFYYLFRDTTVDPWDKYYIDVSLSNILKKELTNCRKDATVQDTLKKITIRHLKFKETKDEIFEKINDKIDPSRSTHPPGSNEWKMKHLVEHALEDVAEMKDKVQFDVDDAILQDRAYQCFRIQGEPLFSLNDALEDICIPDETNIVESQNIAIVVSNEAVVSNDPVKAPKAAKRGGKKISFEAEEGPLSTTTGDAL